MNASHEHDALGPIKTHIENFKRLACWLVGLGTIPPILDLTCNIGPPWPARRGLAYFTTVVLWAVMLWTHSSWHQAPQTRLKTSINRFLIVTVVSLIIFAVLLASFIENAPSPANQIARGFFIKPEQEKILKEGKFPDGTPFPASSVHDLLAANKWKAEVVYPAWTVHLVNIALLLSWLCFFGSLGGLTSVFLLLQEKKSHISEDRGSKKKSGRDPTT